jgi:putative ABC transport system substrate-binding protein
MKQLQLLREAVPRAVRIGILVNPANPWHPLALKSAQGAPRSLGVELRRVEVRRPEDLDPAFAAMARDQIGAALVLSDPMTSFHRFKMADLAATRRLPTMYGVRAYVDAGGLMSYWAHQGDLYRRVVSYVDRIFKGAKPAELPVEQPTRLELVINLKTAKAIGITIPPALLLRADDVIE